MQENGGLQNKEDNSQVVSTESVVRLETQLERNDVRKHG